jgi:hypothetical protein
VKRIQINNIHGEAAEEPGVRLARIQRGSFTGQNVQAAVLGRGFYLSKVRQH